MQTVLRALILAIGVATVGTAAPPEPMSFLKVEQRCRFHLWLGRLVMDPHVYDRGTWSSKSDEPTQFLCITAESGVPSMHYQFEGPAEQWTLDIRNAFDVTLRVQRTDEPLLVYRQPTEGPIELQIGEQSFQGTSLWHLVANDPTPYQKSLEPVMVHFLDDADLTTQLQIVSDRLEGIDERLPRPSESAIHALVASLGASDIADRERATIELTELGPSLLPVLAELPLEELNAEQRRRIQRIRTTLLPNRPDHPDFVATWLRLDKSFTTLLR
jgi:hypothetical protein